MLTPVSFDVNPWVFGDDKFNDLLSKKEQWGDLRKHDLLIECTGEQFQKFRIDILPDAVWLKDANVKAQVAAAYKEAKQMYAKDLRLLLGREITDPERINEVLKDATGTVTVPDYAAAGDINGMFSDTSGAAPAASTPVIPPASDVDFGSLLDDAPTQQPAPPAAQPAQQQPPAPPAQGAPTTQVSSDDVDFDDLLNS